MERISARYEKCVRAVCGGTLPESLRLEGRLDPTRWHLEWNFADWIGRALGVDAAICSEITLSNVLILASVVWQDDLEDGELRVADQGRARHVGEELFEAALEPYRLMLPAGSPFWRAVPMWMEAWRTATTEAGTMHAHRFDASSLAVRGSPLKIPAYGLSLIAGRTDAFPTLEACIDHAMTGLVLYDHYVDWRKDLASGRWNAFVAFVTGATTADVEAAMLVRPVLRDYFALIETELAAAERAAANANVGDLATYLGELAGELREEGESVTGRYISLGERTTQLIFGT